MKNGKKLLSSLFIISALVIFIGAGCEKEESTTDTSNNQPETIETETEPDLTDPAVFLQHELDRLDDLDFSDLGYTKNEDFSLREKDSIVLLFDPTEGDTSAEFDAITIEMRPCSKLQDCVLFLESLEQYKTYWAGRDMTIIDVDDIGGVPDVYYGMYNWSESGKIFQTHMNFLENFYSFEVKEIYRLEGTEGNTATYTDEEMEEKSRELFKKFLQRGL